MVCALDVLLHVGLRPGAVLQALSRLGGLLGLLDADGTPPPDAALIVCDHVNSALRELGEGAYGRAADELFGGRTASARGLPLGRRYAAAATELDIEVATLQRHWVQKLLLDLSLEVYAALPTTLDNHNP